MSDNIVNLVKISKSKNDQQKSFSMDRPNNDKGIFNMNIIESEPDIEPTTPDINSSTADFYLYDDDTPKTLYVAKIFGEEDYEKKIKLYGDYFKFNKVAIIKEPDDIQDNIFKFLFGQIHWSGTLISVPNNIYKAHKDGFKYMVPLNKGYDKYDNIDYTMFPCIKKRCDEYNGGKKTKYRKRNTRRTKRNKTQRRR